jgi:hypothetical protein
MKIKPQLSPPGGHIFKDAEGVTHQGESWAHLVRVVAQYRALRKMQPGNPAKEITEAVCQANPSLCHNGPGEIGNNDRDAFRIRVAHWVSQIVQKVRHKTLRFVEPIKARERADVCRGCPFQDGWQLNCPGCVRASEALHNQIVGSRPQAGAGLLGCALLSEDTAVNVHLDEPRLNDPRLPAHCWRKVK